jgi:hypothetical protein
VTMLYNDEVHSYEQVVSTLRKVLVIDDKKAFEYAAIVDKEGRSAIKRGKKAECGMVKTKVETTMSGPISTALETRVMHHSLVAHQYFAEKIIVWLQKICEMSSMGRLENLENIFRPLPQKCIILFLFFYVK